MQRKVADMGVKDFEALSKDEQIRVSEFLSGSQTDSIMKSDNISDEQKGAISTKQKAAITELITQNGKLLSEKIGDLSIRQIETLGDDFIKENAALFTDSQFADIKKSKKFTEAQTGGFVGARKTALTKMVNDNPDSVFKVGTATASNITTRETEVVYGKSKKTADIAKLPGDVLASPNAIAYLTADVLKAIANSDKDYERVSTTQRETIERLLKEANDNTLRNDPRLKKAVAYLDSAKGQADFIGTSI